ncbi:uncharacterized protein LOC129715107, partial [Leucoraja erinacea]|uniref:uncharacterized protein LOC129715107 n=1 Tax=Leucoraja erinaceus TaxID=7782 RepID=UPI0024581A51
MECLNSIDQKDRAPWPGGGGLRERRERIHCRGARGGSPGTPRVDTLSRRQGASPRDRLDTLSWRHRSKRGTSVWAARPTGSVSRCCRRLGASSTSTSSTSGCSARLLFLSFSPQPPALYNLEQAPSLSGIMGDKSGTRVFKKSSPNCKLTVYLGKRDFIDHLDHVDPVDGVVLVDPEYLKDRRVFVTLTCAFRYGREDLDVLGLSFRKDLFIATFQAFPPLPENE